MKIKKNIYRKFLLSKNSDFISYAISKIHVTYYRYSKNEIFNSFSNLIKKALYFFDDQDLYYKKKVTTHAVIISNIVTIKKINTDNYKL